MKCSCEHDMVRVVPDLLVCECSASGRLANLKGVADDARRLIEREGGFDAVRQRLKDKRAAAVKAAGENRRALLAKWHSAGTYSKQTFVLIPGSPEA